MAFFEALASHDDLQAHLFATSADDGSDIRRRLAAATTLHDVAGLGHDQLAAQLQAARLDILYDLRGWGGGGIPEVFARRPAPVQVNWLAYPGTSGAPWMDYVLADRFVLPPDLATAFSESVAWLPRCFQPSDTRRKIEAAPTRSECGLPESEEREIQRIVLDAYRSLGCRGWSRADLMIRASDRKPFLLEMNTSPGMTGHSLVPMSARASGISYEELCLRILADAALDTPAHPAQGAD